MNTPTSARAIGSRDADDIFQQYKQSAFLSVCFVVGEQGSLLEMDVVEYRKGGDDGSIELGSYIGDGKVLL